MSTPLQRCFLLHQRAYRETSVIVDLLCESEGRVSVVCKGVRGSGNKSASLRSVLQPFAMLAVQWSGKSSLKSLRSAEVLEQAPWLSQHQLYAALYLNELLMRLFQQGELHADLFQHYHSAIADLSRSDAADRSSTEIPLRRFEFTLLATLGFEVDLFYDSSSGEPVLADKSYHFHGEFGLSNIENASLDSDGQAIPQSKKNSVPILGQHILALQQQDYSDDAVRRAAKKIIRLALAPHLGGRPLKSRELYARA